MRAKHPKKSRDWILEKKERRRRQGKYVTKLPSKLLCYRLTRVGYNSNETMYWWFDLVCLSVFNLLLFYTPVFRRAVLWYGDVRPSVRPSVRVSVRPSIRPSIRPSVRHSFPHFSPTCFEILSWNCVCHFILMHVRASLNAINFRQFLLELCPFLTSNSYKYLVFRTFLLHVFIYWVEMLHMTLFHYTMDQVRVSSICVNFVGVMPLLELRILEIHSFPHFFLTFFDILSWNFTYYFVLLYYRSSLGVVNSHQFLAPLHFSAEELLLYPRRPCRHPLRRRRPHAKC